MSSLSCGVLGRVCVHQWLNNQTPPIGLVFGNVITYVSDDSDLVTFSLATQLGMVYGGPKVFYPEERTISLQELDYEMLIFFCEKKGRVAIWNYLMIEWSKEIEMTCSAGDLVIRGPEFALCNDQLWLWWTYIRSLFSQLAKWIHGDLFERQLAGSSFKCILGAGQVLSQLQLPLTVMEKLFSTCKK